MPECIVCGYESDKLYKCKTCGDMFCEECGDTDTKKCLFCLEEEDSDFSDESEVEDQDEEDW